MGEARQRASVLEAAKAVTGMHKLQEVLYVEQFKAMKTGRSMQKLLYLREGPGLLYQCLYVMAHA